MVSDDTHTTSNPTSFGQRARDLPRVQGRVDACCELGVRPFLRLAMTPLRTKEPPPPPLVLTLGVARISDRSDAGFIWQALLSIYLRRKCTAAQVELWTKRHEGSKTKTR